MDIYQQTLDLCIERIRSNVIRFGDQFPFIGDGIHYCLGANDHWMTSFWTGELWLAFTVSNDSYYRNTAATHLQSFRERLTNNVDISHDLGFLYTLSARAQYQMTSDVNSRALALAAASRLAERFNPQGEYIQAWGEIGDSSEGGRFIVDGMMNLPLLYWASVETGDSRFQDVANRHAHTTRRYIVRDDGSTAHTFFMNPKTGEPLGQETHQGYSDDSLWARGQAWSILGFAIAYDWSGDETFLSTSQKTAARFLAELPADGVPLWDFRITVDAPKLRDTSAAVIAAMGFLRLANFFDGELGERYASAARDLMDAQIAVAFDPALDEAEGLLQHATYHATSPELAEQYTLFGDYFFLEALAWLCGNRTDFWGNPASLSQS